MKVRGGAEPFPSLAEARERRSTLEHRVHREMHVEPRVTPQLVRGLNKQETERGKRPLKKPTTHW